VQRDEDNEIVDEITMFNVEDREFGSVQFNAHKIININDSVVKNLTLTGEIYQGNDLVATLDQAFHDSKNA